MSEPNANHRQTPLTDLCDRVARLAALHGYTVTSSLSLRGPDAQVELKAIFSDSGITRTYARTFTLSELEALGAERIASDFCQAAHIGIVPPREQPRISK